MWIWGIRESNEEENKGNNILGIFDSAWAVNYTQLTLTNTLVNTMGY